MKTKILFLILSFYCLPMKAQITYDQTFINGTLYLVHFKYNGDKYFVSDGTSGFTLYYLNHTVFKQVLFPPDTFVNNGIFTYLVTEDLFDTDSSTIDYFLLKMDGPGHLAYCKILNENGVEYFYSDSVFPNVTTYGNEKNWKDPGTFVIQTDSGAKMFLKPFYFVGDRYYIYNLPGHVYTPCPCDGSSAVFINENTSGHKYPMSGYPNPTTGKTTIKYKLPEGVHRAELCILNMQGAVLKQYKITDVFETVELDNSELSSGNYFYQIMLPDGSSQAKQMVIVK